MAASVAEVSTFIDDIPQGTLPSGMLKTGSAIWFQIFVLMVHLTIKCFSEANSLLMSFHLEALGSVRLF